MTDDASTAVWDRDGFVVLPGLLDGADTRAALASARDILPTAPSDDRFRTDFGGITNFPFGSVDLSLLAVHEKLIDLASDLLGVDDVRVYAIEAWAKFTGAADYDQQLHRDYLNHSLLVPAPDQRPRQVEMFVFLDDVEDELGPPAYVSMTHTRHLPPLPNWYPARPAPLDAEHPEWSSPGTHPELYELEQRATGPAGTVVGYRLETFHRGTALHRPLGARYTLHLNFRDAAADWIGRRSWVDDANTPAWSAFVAKATPRQLRLFGFPPPGHDYWSDETIAGVQHRYPGFHGDAWR